MILPKWWAVSLTILFAEHHNFFGVDENYGPIAVSMVRETAERVEDGVIQPLSIYRMIIRISDVRRSYIFLTTFRASVI